MQLVLVLHPMLDQAIDAHLHGRANNSVVLLQLVLHLLNCNLWRPFVLDEDVRQRLRWPNPRAC